VPEHVATSATTALALPLRRRARWVCPLPAGRSR